MESLEFKFREPTREELDEITKEMELFIKTYRVLRCARRVQRGKVSEGNRRVRVASIFEGWRLYIKVVTTERFIKIKL